MAIIIKEDEAKIKTMLITYFNLRIITLSLM